MQIAAALFTVSVVGSALPFAFYDLAFWRIIGGFAIGMASVIGPVCIAEVSPPAYRGRLASFQQAAIIVGIVISQLVNYGILQLADGDQRGEIAGIEAWAVDARRHGRPSRAVRASLLRDPRVAPLPDLRGQGRAGEGSPHRRRGHTVDLDARVAEIGLAMRSEHKSTFRDLLGSRFGFLPIGWVGIGLSAFQQLVGRGSACSPNPRPWSARPLRRS
jgi:MFS family permease